MKPERKLESTFVRNNKAQMETVMSVVAGSIAILIAIIIFANVAYVLPKQGPTINNESWVFWTNDSNTYTNPLAHANVIEDTESVYNVSTPGTILTKDTHYNISDNVLMNITAWTNGTYGVDYKYEETGVVNVKASVATIFYSAVGLVIIGFLVLAAVFILAVVGRLRGKGE